MGSHAAPADHLTLYLQIYPAIKHWFHRWLCMGSHTAPADLPLEWQFHRFLLWQLIFYSYSESSTFGWPGVGISTPIKYWFHRWLFMGYNAAPADHLTTLYLQIYPAIKHCSDRFHRWLCMGSHTAPADLPLEWWFHRFLLWQLIFHSYSESSSFGRPGLGRTTPTSNGNSTDSCEIPISFLL